MAAFASWLIYPNVFNTSPDFQNPICHRITRLKRLSFILICFSYYLAFFFSLSLSFLISRQEAWRLQRMWSSGWLNSLSSEPHTLMSVFFFFFSFLGRIRREKKKSIWRIFVWLLARALMNNCIKTDSDKRPRIFFFFKKKIIRKPSLKHGVLWTIVSSLISWKCISVAKGRICLFLCSFFNLLVFSIPAAQKCFWNTQVF